MSINKYIVAAALSIATATAHAATLGFEFLNPPPESGDFLWLGGEVKTKSYKIESRDLYAVDRQWTYNGLSTALTASACATHITLSRGAGLFTMKSISLAETNGDTGGGATNGPKAYVVFLGTRVDGSLVSRHLETDGVTGWETVRFPSSFRSLKSVTWWQGDCFSNAVHMFDNVLTIDQ